MLSELGDLEITRIAMHPASVMGFGTLGADKVPTFLLPANPSAALVAFEVMVRPLIQLIRGNDSPIAAWYKRAPSPPLNLLPIAVASFVAS